MKARHHSTAGIRSSRLVFLASLLLLQPENLHALPGLSAVWERLYNGNQPFSAENPAHQPEADPDGDGFSNARESLAGTDPFSGLPPDGFPQMRIAPHWLEGQFALSIASSRAGKNYLFSHSTTLEPGSWTSFPEPFQGNGQELYIPFIPETEGGGAPPEKAFFRATISDPPNPGGSFSPWELSILAARPDIAAAVLPPPVVVDGPDTPPPDPNSDNAGPSDRYDVAPQDDKMNWVKNPEARYLHIAATVPGGVFRAIDVSDTGKILFSGSITLTDPATQPVGYVWDPLAAPANRLIPVMFNAQTFSLFCRRKTGGELTYVSEVMPLPTPVPPAAGVPIKSVSVTVNLKAIGDDGSLLADVDYSLFEYDANSEAEIRSVHAKLVFLWQQSQYGSCKLIGDDRGRKFEGASQTETDTQDFSVGFYTVPSTTPPETLAVSTRQTVYADTDKKAPLEVRTTETIGLAVGGMIGQKERIGPSDPRPRMTRTGKIILEDFYGNVVRYIACGAVPTTTLPPETYFNAVSDLPDGLPGSISDGRWGIGSPGEPFRMVDGTALSQLTSAQNVMQWDRYGIGIGSSAAEAIWRNGRMHPLSSLVMGLPSNMGSISPRKITPSGLIWIGNDEGLVNGLLVPIEVVAPDLDHNDVQSTEYPLLGAAALKVAKMEHSLNDQDQLDIDIDPHRFRVRIPAKLGTAAQISLGTVENPEDQYDDNPDILNLTLSPYGMLQTQTLLLVSDDIDDEADGQDDREDDRTHKIQLGGSVKISSVKIGETSYPFDMKVPVKVKKRLNGTIIMVGNTGIYSADIEAFNKIAKERYAQIGVDFNFNITDMPLPSSIQDENNIRAQSISIPLPGGGYEYAPNSDFAALVDQAVLVGKRTPITVFVVRDMIGDDRGMAVVKKFLGTSYQGYGNIVVLSGFDMIVAPNPVGSFPGRKAWFTVAHEAGHLLTEAGHYGASGPSSGKPDQMTDYGSGDPHLILHNLMKQGTSNINTLNASKRLHRMQDLLCLPEIMTDP